MISVKDYCETNTYVEICTEECQDIYANSALKGLKRLSSRKKGKYFERLYQEYAKSLGSVVEKPVNSGHDRIVDGRKKEIKGSFLWGNGTHFRWQQIRPSQDYDDVIFIALYPDRIEFYEADKKTVKNIVETKNDHGEWVHNQHGGKKVNSGTFFLDGFPCDYPWMKNV